MRVLSIICFILLFPLVTGFSQASIIPGVVCVHCQKMQKSRPDCCGVMKHGGQKSDAGKIAQSDKQSGNRCPHAGLCGGDTDPFIDVLPVTTTYKIVTSVPVATLGKYFPISREEQSRATGLSSPLKKHPPLFTLNCSFLI